jgi:hypothetical protein
MKIYEKDFNGCFCGSYAAGTDGWTGGDGTKTILEFRFKGGCIDFDVKEDSVDVKAGGDSELEYLIEAFEWIAKKLKKQIEENKR